MFNRDEQATHFGATPIDNLFITDYLAEAPAEAVKVYLWLSHRLLWGPAPESLKQMAEELNLDLHEVERALRYWERRRLLQRTADRPPQYVLYSLPFLAVTGQDGLRGDESYHQFAESVYALFGDRRKITPKDIARAWEWVDEKVLPQELVLMMLQHLMDTRGVGFGFSTVGNRFALEMKDAGIVDMDGAELFFQHDKTTHDCARQVLRRFGLSRQPTFDELNLAHVWMVDWGFTREDVLAACTETVKATNPSFGYLDKILQGLKNRRGAKATKVSSLISAEAQELDELKVLTAAMGLTVPPVSLLTAYRALRQDHAADLILLAAQSGPTGKRVYFEDLSPILSGWKDRGIDNVKDAQKLMKQQAAEAAKVASIFSTVGLSGKPGDKSLSFYRQWQALGFNDEMIMLAATHVAEQPGMKLNNISKTLKEWAKQGIKDKARAKAWTDSQPRAAAGGPRAVPAQQYDQRRYSEDTMKRMSGIDLIEEAQRDDG